MVIEPVMMQRDYLPGSIQGWHKVTGRRGDSRCVFIQIGKYTELSIAILSQQCKPDWFVGLSAKKLQHINALSQSRLQLNGSCFLEDAFRNRLPI